MKLNFTFILLFICLSANAKFIYGTITFKDGRIEAGYIKSFMEMDILDLHFSSKIEKMFNMDDKSLKFKLNEDGEVKTYNATEIKELRFDYVDGSTSIYVPLPIKTFNKKGEMVDMKILIWLPLVKRGKINLYGIQYSIRSSGIMGTSHHTQFYFRNENDDFAVYPYQKMSMFNRKANRRIKTAFYKYLFSSCSEFYETNAERLRKVIYYDFTKEEKNERLRAESNGHFSYQYNENYRTLKNALKTYHPDTAIFINEFEEVCNK